MSAGNILAILGVLVLASFLVSFTLYRLDPEFGKVIAAVQAIISIGGLFIAAYWFFVERKGMPHADIVLSADVARLSERAVLVLVRADVTNKGVGLLTLGKREIRLLAVRMGDGTLNEVLALDTAAFPATLKSGRELFDHGEVAWRGLRQFTSDRPIEIEPGEKDSVFVDFVVPCTERVLKISASIRKPGEGDMWYKDRKLISIEQACASGTEKAARGKAT